MIWQAIWDGFVGFLLFGFLGFIVGICFMFLLFTKGLLKREKPMAKVFVILFWIFIPLFTSWEFAALKTIHIAETTAKGSATIAIDQLEESSFPAFHDYVTKNINDLTAGSKAPTNEELAHAFYESSPKTSSWISKSVLVWLLDLAEELAEENIAEQTGLKTEQVHAFRLMQDDAMDGLFGEAMQKLKNGAHSLIGSAFIPYYLIALLIWLGCMILPAVEIIFFVRNRKKASH